MRCKEVMRAEGAKLLPRTCPVHGLNCGPGVVLKTPVKAPINNVDKGVVEDFATSCNDGDTLFERYQYLALKSAIYPGKNTPFGLMYAALGLAEAGEVQNKVKKLFRDDDVIHLMPTDYGAEAFFSSISSERRAQIVKELGGVLWYVAAVCTELGVDMSEVAVTNLREIASRSERGTLGGDGDDR